MPDRRVLFVPLPKGRATVPGVGPLGFLSVAVVPQLMEPGPLNSWTADFINWPKVVNGTNAAATKLGISVYIDGVLAPANTGIVVSSPQWTSAAPNDVAWPATFGVGPSSIAVDKFRFADQRNVTFPANFAARSFLDDAQALYDDLAANTPTVPPTRGQLAANPRYIAIQNSGHLDEYDEHIKILKSIAGSYDEDDPTTEITPADVVDFDFHQALAYIDAHPQLARSLGLVIDLIVALPDPSVGSVALETNYQTIYDGVGGRAASITFSTSCSDSFWPDHDPATPPNGIDTSGFYAHLAGTHELDHFDLTSTVEGISLSEPNSASTESGETAAVEEAGVNIIRDGQDIALEIAERFQRQMAIYQEIERRYRGVATGPVEVDVRDVVIGRRYDIFDTSTNQWRSVWDREVPAGFDFPDAPALSITPADDEGWITQSVYTEAIEDIEVPPDDPNGEFPTPPFIDRTPFRIPPVAFQWRGWSLVAPQPGKALTASGLAKVQLANEAPATSPVQVGVDYRVPDGVLPRLRYGHTYKVRARLVDLAGNSKTVAAAHPNTGETETALHTFGRLSPMPMPDVIRRENQLDPSPADGSTLLVIKSELGQDDATVTPTSRMIFPPQVSQTRCLLHGKPDPDGLFTSTLVFDDIVARDAADLEDQAVVDPNSGELRNATPANWRPPVDYLVEPFAEGITFSGLHGATGDVKIPLRGTWPAVEAFGIEMRAGTAGPSISTGTGPTLTTYVPKACVIDVDLSAAIDPVALDHFTLYNRMASGDQTATASTITDGRHWMLSRRRKITLVHAVRLPLLAPDVDTKLTADRPTKNAVTATLSGVLDLDLKSTQRVEFTGTWTDPVDPLDEAGPEFEVRSEVIHTETPQPSPAQTLTMNDSRFDMPDTKRHDVTLSLEAFSRFTHHFTERKTVVFKDPDETLVLHPDGISSNRFDASPAREDVDFTLNRATGEMQRIPSGSIPLDTPIDVDFIRLPVSRFSAEHAVPTYDVLIPNAGTPSVLPISSSLPAVSRQIQISASRVHVRHSGQVIRVWIERPWYQTGDREMVAVVVDPAAAGVGATGSTRWGRDALTTVGLANQPTVANFPRAIETATNVDGSGLDVAAHEAKYDAAAQLWYCDIEVAGDIGYRPFVRFALARYQPDSISGCKLGEVVEPEAVHLGVERTVTVEPRAGSVAVSVSGVDNDNIVRARVQRSEPGIGDTDLSWVDEGDEVELTRSTSSGLTFFTGEVPLPTTTRPVRLLVEDAEQLDRQSGAGVDVADSVVFFETVEIPAAWQY